MESRTLVNARVRWAALRFRAHRADYYEYLADVMAGTGGKKTLRDIFRSDAARYGKAHARGVLSAYWAERYQEVGGDLHDTFAGTLPPDDIIFLRMAQKAGAGALEQTLRDVGSISRLIEQARDTFVSTIAVGVVAIGVLLAMISAVPWFTVPRLKQAFGSLPDEFLGSSARRLYAFADGVDAHFFTLAMGVAVFVYLLAWSLPNLVGPWRSRLDEWFIWRLYRDFHGIRFLATLATMVKRRGNVTTGLREALEMQLDGTTAWRRWHMEKMIARIDDGQVGTSTFETGIVDNETLWFLTDLITAQGMDAALMRARSRVEIRSLKDVARKASSARWVMLVFAVATLFFIMSWHFSVINEMRGALTNYYSSR